MNTWQSIGFLRKNCYNKWPHPLNPKVLELICVAFQIYIFCYVYRTSGFKEVILATDSQNLGRLNRKLVFENGTWFKFKVVTDNWIHLKKKNQNINVYKIT